MSACRLSPCARMSLSDSLRIGTPVNVRGHILYTPRMAESLQRFGQRRVRKSLTPVGERRFWPGGPRLGGTGESEALEEFCKEVDAAARWKRHRRTMRWGESFRSQDELPRACLC